MARRGGNVPVVRPWRQHEDELLTNLVQQNGPRNWSALSNSIPGRTGKSCRLRWLNHLKPLLDRRPFTPEEDLIIIRVHAMVGRKWAYIARQLEGRTDNAVMNRWNSTIGPRLINAEVQSCVTELSRPDPEEEMSDASWPVMREGPDPVQFGVDVENPVRDEPGSV